MSQPFYKRLLVYQKERFPILVHVPLIAAFSFAVIAYSRACRGAEGFIALPNYVACVFTNVTLFFMLRVADEHKDNEDDLQFRKYLPVPRGLISLKELAKLAWVLFGIATIINILFFQQLLLLYFIMMVYLLLMRYEFFIPHWLKRHQVAYIISHMLIIPLADVYASGYDWKLLDLTPSTGLFYFFGVSYISGIILEVGRKLRVADTEEEGVVSYTKLWGMKGAPIIWVILLTLNFVLVHSAINKAVGNYLSAMILNIVFAIAVIPAVIFLVKPSKAVTKLIEVMSLAWSLGMYLILGSTQFI